MLGRHAHERPAEALALQQAAKRLGGAREPLRDLLPVVELPRANPAADHVHQLRQTMQVIVNYEPPHCRARSDERPEQ